MEKLWKVELAQKYVELLQDVDNLKQEAKSHLPGNPKEALRPYTRLKEIAMLMRELQEPAEGAAVHLVKFVEETTNDLWIEMKQIMLVEFEGVLKKSKWPESSSEPTAEFRESFEKLLVLQTPEIISAREPLVLLPMGVLAKPFIQQFRYHFFSDKPTNQPQQVSTMFRCKIVLANMP